MQTNPERAMKHAYGTVVFAKSDFCLLLKHWSNLYNRGVETHQHGTPNVVRTQLVPFCQLPTDTAFCSICSCAVGVFPAVPSCSGNVSYPFEPALECASDSETSETHPCDE